MRKPITFYTVVSLILLTLSSCDIVQNEKIRSLVLSYSLIDSISLDTLTFQNIHIRGVKISDKVDWKSKGDNKVKYDALCKKHDDMSYYKKVSYIAYPEFGHYFMEDIESINVVSDKEFDAQHPAGSSLKDVVRFCGISPYKFIKSGYKTSYNWNSLPKGYTMDKKLSELISSNLHSTDKNNTDFIKENYPIDNLLSELKPEDFILAGLGNLWTSIGVLIFERKPTVIPATHILTVSVITETGKTLTAKIHYKFR